MPLGSEGVMSARDRTIGPMLEAITAQRTTLLADVAALTPAQRTWRGAPHAWSAVDVIEHLVLAEQVVLGDLATAADRADMPRRVVHRVRSVMVWLVLRLGVRVSVPAEAMRPTGSASFEVLRERWDAQHRALHAFVGGLDAAGLRRRVFRHPIAGPLDVPQALRLLSAHLSTHQRQLARIRAERDGHPRR
jgi:hypothetical protein